MPVLLRIFLFLFFSPAAFSQAASQQLSEAALPGRSRVPQAVFSHSFLGEEAALAEKTPAYDFRDEFNRPLSKESFAFQLWQSELEQKADFFFMEELPSTRQRLAPLKEALRAFFTRWKRLPLSPAALISAAFSSLKRTERLPVCPPWAACLGLALLFPWFSRLFSILPHSVRLYALRC